MRHSFLYRGQHIAVEMASRDAGLSWRFAVNGGEYCRGDGSLDFASAGAGALARACAAARVAVDLIELRGSLSLDSAGRGPSSR